jgi:hypothetical protein
LFRDVKFTVFRAKGDVSTLKSPFGRTQPFDMAWLNSAQGVKFSVAFERFQGLAQ